MTRHLTTFVGRRSELDVLARLVDSHRVVTITGAGGSGKSRLAGETLSRRLDGGNDDDGGWFVDLAGATDAEAAAELVARVVSPAADVGADPIRSIVAVLRAQQRLLCLDTCEHVLEAAAGLAAAVASECPGVTVLATSREPLNLAGEVVWRLPAMSPADATELFVDRARAAAPGFEAFEASDDVDAIDAIVARLDGIPLALELAAAWTRTLRPGEIAGALDDRFRLLVGGPAGASSARQRTLLASVEWSHDLLDPAAQALLRRLSVFAGPVGLDAVVGVCGEDVLPSLRRLVDASLVDADGRTAGTGTTGESRYRLPETVRAFAAVQLDAAGERTEVRDRRLRYFRDVLEGVEADLVVHDHDEVLAGPAADHADLVAAIEWGLASEGSAAGRAERTDDARRLAAALGWFWMTRGHAPEGVRLLRRALAAAPDEVSPLQGRLHAALAMLAVPTGRIELLAEAARAAEIGRALDDPAVLARGLAVGTYEWFYRDFARAEAVAREVQRLGETARVELAVDFALLIEACSQTNRDLHAQAVATAATLRHRAAGRNDRFSESLGRSVEVWAVALGGDVRRALQLAREAAEVAAPLGDYLTTGTNLANLAWVLGLAGDVADAQALLEPVLASLREAGPDVDVIGARVVAGKLALWAGDADAAVGWLRRVVDQVPEGADDWMATRALPELASALRRLGRLDEAADLAETAVGMARRMGSRHVEAEGLDELGHLAAPGDPRRALALHHEALAVRVDSDLWTFVPSSLDAVARRHAELGEPEEALRLLGAADAGRAVVGLPRPGFDQRAHDELTASLRGDLSAAGGAADAADAAIAAGAGLTLDEAVAHARRHRGRRGRPPAGWASLTPSELRVVDLVVEGLTNADIAGRLFVAPETVKTHLSHVYRKLGVSNRAELATAATRRELAPG